MVVAVVIIGISALIIIHELGHFLAAKLHGLYVEEFGFGFPPRIFSKKIGETLYSFNLLPFGGFVKIHGESRDAVKAGMESRSFAYQSFWKKASIVLSGVAMNFVVGWFVVSAVFMIGTPKTLVVTDVAAGSPAAAAGLHEGDILMHFQSAEKFISFVNENRGRQVTLAINRGGKQLEISVVPRISPPDGEGALGVGFTEAGVPATPILTSLWEGFRTSLFIVAAIFSAIGKLLFTLFTSGQILESFVGPVGIFGIANQAASIGLPFLFQLLGLISLNLFILNILPFPALDGGRMLFLIIEKLRGAPFSAKTERSANAVGFLLLILLMIAITVRDVINLFG